MKLKRNGGRRLRKRDRSGRGRGRKKKEKSPHDLTKKPVVGSAFLPTREKEAMKPANEVDGVATIKKKKKKPPLNMVIRLSIGPDRPSEKCGDYRKKGMVKKVEKSRQRGGRETGKIQGLCSLGKGVKEERLA